MKKPLRILVIAPTPFFADRGNHVRILEECSVLKKAGHQIQIVTYGLGRAIDGLDIKRTFRFPWYKKTSAGPSWHKVYVDVFLFFSCLRRAIAFNPDIIHCHLHEGCLIGWAVGKLTRTPFIFDYQGGMTTEMRNHKFIKPGSFIFKTFNRIESFIDRLPRDIVTSSKMGKDELVSVYNIPEENISVVCDGIGEVNIKKGGFDLKEKYLIPAENKVVVFVGVLSDYQGIDLLIEGMAKAKHKLKDATFIIFGFPEEGYIAKAKKLGIKNVIFPGKLMYEKLYEYLAQADFAIAPKISTTEGNGKVYNYMAAGLPVVLFDSPINREIIGNKGIFAELGNGEDLIRKVIDTVSGNFGKINYGLQNDIFWSSRLKVLEAAYQRNL